jgi:TRAP-type C4-dicarboxylate transport system permease small subunit
MTMGYMYLVLFLSGLIMTSYVLMNLYIAISSRSAEMSD